MGVRPAGVDHDEGDEGATQAIEKGKNVVIAINWCRRWSGEKRRKEERDERRSGRVADDVTSYLVRRRKEKGKFTRTPATYMSFERDFQGLPARAWSLL